MGDAEELVDEPVVEPGVLEAVVELVVVDQVRGPV